MNRLKSKRNALLRALRSRLLRQLYRLRSGPQAEGALRLSRWINAVHRSSFAVSAQMHLLYILNRHDELSDVAWKVVLGDPKFRRSQTSLHVLLKSAWVLQDELLLDMVLDILKSTTMSPGNLSYIAARKGAHPACAYAAMHLSCKAKTELIGLLSSGRKPVQQITERVRVLETVEDFELPPSMIDALAALEGQAGIHRYLARRAAVLEDWPAAWDQFDRACEANPRDVRVYVDLAEVALYFPDAEARIEQLCARRKAAGVLPNGYDKLLGHKHLTTGNYRAYLTLRGVNVSNLVAQQEYGARCTGKSMGAGATAYVKTPGSVFVIGRDGVSDELRWAYYYKKLFQYYSKVAISCDPRLERLFARSLPGVELYPVTRNWGRLQTQSHDIARDQVPNMELASRLDNRAYAASKQADEVMFIEDVALRDWITRGIEAPPIEGEPKGATILPDPERAAYWRNRLDSESGARLKIGLIWRSGLIDAERARHYMRLEDFEPLAGLPVSLYSIQHQANKEEYAIGARMGVRFVDDEVDFYNDFDEIAAMTSALDLVIGISTLPYEMAAAVGVESWACVISPFGRWLRVGRDGTTYDRLTRNGRVFYCRDGVDYLSGRPARVRSILDQMIQELAARGMTRGITEKMAGGA